MGDIKAHITEIRATYYKDDDEYWMEFMNEIKDTQNIANKKKLENHKRHIVDKMSRYERQVKRSNRMIKRYESYLKRCRRERTKKRIQEYIDREKKSIEAYKAVLNHYKDTMMEVEEEL